MVDSRIQYSEFAWHETCKKHIFSFLGALYQKLSVTFSKSSIVTFFDLLVTFSCAGQAGARVYPNRVYPDPYPYPTGTGLVRVHTQKSSGRVRSQLLYPRVYPIPQQGKSGVLLRIFSHFFIKIGKLFELLPTFTQYILLQIL